MNHEEKIRFYHEQLATNLNITARYLDSEGYEFSGMYARRVIESYSFLIMTSILTSLQDHITDIQTWQPSQVVKLIKNIDRLTFSKEQVSEKGMFYVNVSQLIGYYSKLNFLLHTPALNQIENLEELQNIAVTACKDTIRAFDGYFESEVIFQAERPKAIKCHKCQKTTVVYTNQFETDCACVFCQEEFTINFLGRIIGGRAKQLDCPDCGTKFVIHNDTLSWVASNGFTCDCKGCGGILAFPIEIKFLNEESLEQSNHRSAMYEFANTYVTNKIEECAQAKVDKDYALSDQIRDELKGLGIEVMDSATGTTWKAVHVPSVSDGKKLTDEILFKSDFETVQP